MNFYKNNQAQLTVAGLLIIYIILMFMSSMMPELSKESSDVYNHENITSKPYAKLFDLIPLFIITVFLVTIALSAGLR